MRVLRMTSWVGGLLTFLFFFIVGGRQGHGVPLCFVLFEKFIGAYPASGGVNEDVVMGMMSFWPFQASSSVQLSNYVG